MLSRLEAQSVTLLGSGSSRGRSALGRALRRGAEPLLLPAAGAIVIGLQVLAVGQVWRRLLMPAIGPLEAPSFTHQAARPSGAVATTSHNGQNATFAHELRRRLAALRVLSEAIEIRAAEDDVDRLVHMLVRELHDLEQLESAMLGSTRRDALEDVDVFEVAKAAAQTVGWARQSEINVQGSKRLLRVRSNPTMLRQALENLMDNAATCGEGQPVDVIVRCSIARRLTGVEVLVADRGPGLGRAPAGRRSNGVGLPFVRKFVQESSGRLWSHNREGGGALFGLWLPAEGLAGPNGGGAVDGSAQPARTHENGHRNGNGTGHMSGNGHMNGNGHMSGNGNGNGHRNRAGQTNGTSHRNGTGSGNGRDGIRA